MKKATSSLTNTDILKLESLNGIRGFAILLVLLSHAANVDVFLIKGINLSGAGHYGVFLFFVLSSFLLTRQFLELEKDEDLYGSVIRNYFLRRFLRIYPLFTVMLIVYYLLCKIGLLVIPVSGIMIVKSLLLLDAEGIFWTVPVEFQFYFILPFVSYLLIRQSNPLYTILIGGILCGVWTFFFPPEYTTHVIPFMPIFIIGSLTAKLYVSSSNMKRINQNSHDTDRCKLYNFLSLLMMISFIVLAPHIYNSIMPSGIGTVDLQKQFILFALLSSEFILCTLLSNGIVRRLMESRFFVFWGNVSFSAYLGHKIILAFVYELEFIPSPVKFMLFFSCTALFSYFSYRYLERPLAKINTFKKVLILR